MLYYDNSQHLIMFKANPVRLCCQFMATLQQSIKPTLNANVAEVS